MYNFAIFSILSCILVALTTVHGASQAEILADLLQDYDGNIRPSGVNGSTSPTIVTVNFYIRSIPEIDDVKMRYSTQLTFRVQWMDERLRFNNFNGRNFITIPPKLGAKLWKPDIFFSNELEYKLHDGLLTNQYYRVFPGGEILYSSRISLTLSCPMILKLYPFDKQTCSLRLASYGSTTEDIIFKWKAFDPVQVTSDLHLPKFALEQFTTDYCDSMTNTGIYSCLRLDILFKREASRYLCEIFFPTILSILVVSLSMWISPLNPGVTVARALMLLAGAFYCKSISWSTVSTSVAIVSYTTALDVWIAGNSLFLFVALLQFVVVLGTRGGGGGGAKEEENYHPSRLHKCAVTMDWTLRILYPIAYLLCVALYFGAFLMRKDGEEIE